MTELGTFAGRFHPLLVHFPIALLLLAALLQALAAQRERRRPGAVSPLRSAAGLVLGLGAIGAGLSAGAGWLLGESGGYAGDAYTRHKWLGVAVAATALLSAIAWTLRGRRPAFTRAQTGLLAASVLLLVPAGHLGATLTHGDDYLTEHAPGFARRWLGGGGRSAPARLAARAPDRTGVYASLVAPVLEANCVPCHGAARVQGGLRLDSPEGVKKGGDKGAILVAGRAASSEMIRRIWLPRSHKQAMPPRPHRPIPPADASLLRWWIEEGASFEATLADAEIAAEILPLVEALVGPVARGGPTLPVAEVAPADPAAVAGVVARGLTVETIAEGLPFLHVHATNAGARIGDADLEPLTRLAPQVIWLDLSGTSVSDAGVPAMARLPHLIRLHLQRTKITDAGLAALGPLASLEYLNLYGTAVTDAGLAPLAELTKLRTLYVWRTQVTPAGAARLTARLPRLSIDTGLAAPAPGAAPPAADSVKPAATE